MVEGRETAMQAGSVGLREHRLRLLQLPALSVLGIQVRAPSSIPSLKTSISACD